MRLIREAEGLEPVLTGQPDSPAARRAREPIVVLHGADDPGLHGRFRQSNNFAYLTGVEVPSATLVLYPGRDQEVLYLPPAGAGHGDPLGAAPPGPGPETAAVLGFATVESTARLLGDLLGAIGDPQVRTPRGSRASLYVLDPQGNGTERTGSAERRLISLLQDAAPNTTFRDIAPHLHSMRRVKSDAELELLRRAIDITCEAQQAVAQVIRPGIHEYELQGEILGTFLRGGAEREGFPSIVGSGPNAAIPHYFGTRRRLEAGDLVVVDIGAEYRMYTADITRTYPVRGSFTPRQRAIYQLVLDAQEAAERQIKPGETTLGELTGFVRAFFNASPLRATDASGAEVPLGRFFSHGIGHRLGMDVHDVGSSREPLQVGEVFTIEPGLYLPAEGLGIRIEDDYVMTAEGPLKLSVAIPSDPGEIERLVCRARAEVNEAAIEVPDDAEPAPVGR